VVFQWLEPPGIPEGLAGKLGVICYICSKGHFFSAFYMAQKPEKQAFVREIANRFNAIHRIQPRKIPSPQGFSQAVSPYRARFTLFSAAFAFFS
jgi:hypothetical protein